MRRRALLASTLGTAGIAALAGCSTSEATSLATLDRIVLRADTDHTEPLDLTLVYAPRDGTTERPVWGTYEAPDSGDTVVVDDFAGDPGFYSLTAHSQTQDNLEVGSFNSHGDGPGGDPLQFEVVVQQSGDVWLNLNGSGEEISIPDYSP